MLRNGRNNKSYVERDEVKGWAEILSDDNNRWFNAIRKVSENDVAGAIYDFVEDAYNIVDFSLARAALSLFNAGVCSMRLKQYEIARKCFELSADFYAVKADDSVRNDPRSSIWFYARAAVAYKLAGMDNHAKEVAELSKLIEKSVNPQVERYEVDEQLFELGKAKDRAAHTDINGINSEQIDYIMNRIREVREKARTLWPNLRS